MKLSIMLVAKNQALKWIIGFISVISVASKIWFFSYNPYFRLVDLDIKYYGYIFFIINLIAWLTSYYANAIKKRLKEQTIIKLMVLFIGIPILLMGLIISKVSISLILFQNVIRGFQKPFLTDFINQKINSFNRAAILSFNYTFNGIAAFIGLSIFGQITKLYQLNICLQILGLLVLCLGYCFVSYYNRNIYKNP